MSIVEIALAETFHHPQLHGRAQWLHQVTGHGLPIVHRTVIETQPGIQAMGQALADSFMVDQRVGQREQGIHRVGWRPPLPSLETQVGG
ncbi:hypothetical protein D3C73_1496340 [compost metagenome]